MDTLRKYKSQLEDKLKATENNQSDKVEKNLMKSLIINYVVSNGINDKNQILKLISTILDFSENEFDKVGLNKPMGGGWFSSLVPVVPGKFLVTFFNHDMCRSDSCLTKGIKPPYRFR